MEDRVIPARRTDAELVEAQPGSVEIEQILAPGEIRDRIVARSVRENKHVRPGVTGQDVVAGAAIEGVITALPIQRIGAEVAGDLVVFAVFGSVDTGLTQQGQMFEIIAELVADIGLNGVDSAVRLFNDLVASIIGDINMVTFATS